jgi:hypothetical protein
MQVIAVQPWNHHEPHKKMVRINPGDKITVPDNLGRYMIREKWVKGA